MKGWRRPCSRAIIPARAWNMKQTARTRGRDGKEHSQQEGDSDTEAVKEEENVPDKDEETRPLTD